MRNGRSNCGRLYKNELCEDKSQRYDKGADSAAADSVCTSAFLRKRVPAVLQYGGQRRGGKFCQCGCAGSRDHDGLGGQYASWTFYGNVNRSQRGDLALLWKKGPCRSSQGGAHRSFCDLSPWSVHDGGGSRHHSDASSLHADAGEHCAACFGVSENLLPWNRRPDVLQHDLGDSPRGRRFEEASPVPDYHKPPERGTGSSVRPVFSAWRCRGCLCDDSVAVRIGISGAVCVIPEHGGLWNFLPGNAD